MAQGAKNSLTTFELNATRVQAVRGAGGDSPNVLPLDDSQDELPMALSLEGRQIEVGQAGLGLCRRLPHLACLDYLGYLGTERHWSGGKHRLDASKAVAHVFARIQTVAGNAGGVLLSIPAYFNEEQRQTVTRLAEKAHWQVLGSIKIPLAAALAAHTEQAWSGLALVVDVDDYALTCSAVLGGDSQARLLATLSFPRLGVRAWKEKLLDAIAHRCVRQSRRDPRDSAPAEQSLYEQLDAVLAGCRRGQLAEIVIQTDNWCQNLLLRPEELAEVCSPLVGHVVEEMRSLQEAMAEYGAPLLVALTSGAALLPGLLAALEEAFPPAGPRVVGHPISDEDFGDSLIEDSPEDFGDDLVEIESLESLTVLVLAADAPIRAAHEIAARLHRQELPRGPVDLAPLPAPVPVNAGPVRLKFNRQDYLLGNRSFTLGRHPNCDLVFDSTLHPTVSAYHCEIAPEQTSFVLRDHSRNGTLVNDRPVIGELTLRAGDWIRLGPAGPLIRFLGKPVDQRQQWSLIS
ncbi:MAG: FHA domain-containing protein [Gemmataceae bacterium]